MSNFNQENEIIKNDIDENEDIENNLNYIPYNTHNLDYKKVFFRQLEEMRQLGLYDIDLNISYLKQTNGNVVHAVSLIFESFE